MSRIPVRLYARALRIIVVSRTQHQNPLVEGRRQYFVAFGRNRRAR